jgi:hypothetical protein
MAAATVDIDTKEIKFPRFLAGKFNLLNDTILYAGIMQAIDYTDEVQPAADTAGLKVIGRCPLGQDNAADGLTGTTEMGIFRYANSSTHVIPRSAIGQECYVEDNQTVAGWSTNLVPAGLIYDVDDDGVWVDQRAEALAAAWLRRPVKRVAKVAAYEVTDAIGFEGRTYFHMTLTAGGAVEITLPGAVAGMRVGVQRGSATAADDVTIQAATGDTIEASDAVCAAGKQIDNTVDAISQILWLRAVTDGAWKIDNPMPTDVTSWVKNDA